MSNKKTDKQKVEQYRQKIAKQYRDSNNELQNNNKKLCDELAVTKSKLEELELDKEQLTKVVAEQSILIQELKEKVDLSEEELLKLKENIQHRHDINNTIQKLGTITDTMNHLLFR